MTRLKRKTPQTNVRDLKRKYPTYQWDHESHRSKIALLCLDHRVCNSASQDNKFWTRPEVMERYFPYIPKDSPDMSGAKEHQTEWFRANKDRPEFVPYYFKPNMEFIFKEQRLNINPLPEVEYQPELPMVLAEANTIVVDTKGTPYEVGEIIVKYGDRMYKSPCHSNEELNRYIDLSKEFL